MDKQEYRKNVELAAHEELLPQILALAPEDPDYRHGFFIEQLDIERFNDTIVPSDKPFKTYILEYMGDSCDETTLYVINASSEQEARELASRKDRSGKWDEEHATCMTADIRGRGIVASAFSGC